MAINKHKPIPELTEKEKARFWSKVGVSEPSVCWPWIGRKDKNGYGIFQTFRGGKEQNWRATRVAWKLLKEDPADLEMAHSCDNPPCMNGSHLNAETHVDNMKEIKLRGRCATGDRSGARRHPERIRRGDSHPARLHPERVSGTNNPMAKLTAEQVSEIRSVYMPRSGKSFGNSAHLSSIYGVSAIVIRRIGRGTSYLNVPARDGKSGLTIPEWANVDMHKKNQPRGLSAGAAKLTQGQVDEIRKRYTFSTVGKKTGAKAMAREYGISPSHMLNIARGSAWYKATPETLPDGCKMPLSSLSVLS
jgi:hypothetical protein